MKNFKTNLICSNTDLQTVKINHEILQDDSLPPILFVVSLLPLTLVLRKMKQGYYFSKRKSKLNHLLFMDDLKQYGGSQPVLTVLYRLYTL